MITKNVIRRLLTGLSLIALGFGVALAGPPDRGQLLHDGQVVRTLVPPASMKKAGVDNLYVIMGGIEAQLPVAAVAPGDTGYHGGKWAVHVVTWDGMATPYLLDSEAAVLQAENDGDVTVVRMPGADFKCPIQP